MTEKTTSLDKPLVGISQCLLGARVRYDGDSRPLSSSTLDLLEDAFNLVSVCPEVEAGLGVPRPPVQLTASIEQPLVTGRDNPELDVTNILQSFADERMHVLTELNGFIFKSRSPSCGLASTPVFIAGEMATDSSRGVFARTFCENYPNAVVIEDSKLESRTALLHFIDAVTALHEAG